MCGIPANNALSVPFNPLLSLSFVCSFVGWLTNFIRQRHRAAASCAYSYSRLTFVRRMPPLIRSRLQQSQQKHGMNTTYRGYIAPYKPHTGRGTTALVVKGRTWRNTRPIREEDKSLLKRSVRPITLKHVVVHDYAFDLYSTLSSIMMHCSSSLSHCMRN